MKNEIMIPLTPPGNFNLLFIKSQELGDGGKHHRSRFARDGGHLPSTT